MDIMQVKLGGVADNGGRNDWESGSLYYGSQGLRNRPLHFLSAPIESMLKKYTVKYHVCCTNSPSRSHLPQFSLVFPDKKGDMKLMSLPMSCQGFLRSRLLYLMRSSSYLKIAEMEPVFLKGPLRLFFEMSPAMLRPSIKMRRAFRMAQSLTEFIGEDPSKVKLYKASLPELSSVKQAVLKDFEGLLKKYKKDSILDIKCDKVLRKARETGTMFLNQDRMYVLEAPAVWIDSPYALSVFGRLTRNALFKNPIRIKDYKTHTAFIKALYRWEGLYRSEGMWVKAFNFLKGTSNRISPEINRKSNWDGERNVFPRGKYNYTVGVDDIGLNEFAD